MKQTSSALEVVSLYAQALKSRDSDNMNRLRSEEFVLDFVYRDAFQRGPVSAEDTDSFWPAWFKAFPEFDYEVTRTMVSDEVVVMQWIFTGTHADTLEPPAFDPPLDATGRTIQLRGVSFYDVTDGLIQKETLYMDLATLMVELGVER